MRYHRFQNEKALNEERNMQQGQQDNKEDDAKTLNHTSSLYGESAMHQNILTQKECIQNTSVAIILIDRFTSILPWALVPL